LCRGAGSNEAAQDPDLRGSPPRVTDELDRTGNAQRKPEAEQHARERLVLERRASEVPDLRV
jgi:hypothetical protein